MMKQTITETLMKVFNLEAPPSDNVIDLLKADHRKVEKLFKDFEHAKSKDDKLAILKEVITELNLHSAAEEKLVYSTLKDGEEDKVEEAFEEHHLAKFLLAELDQFDGSEENFEAKVKALSEVIQHHVKEEEQQMLPKLRTSDNDLEELGREFLEEKEELKANPPALDLEKFSQNANEEEESKKKAAAAHSRKVATRKGSKAKDVKTDAKATKKSGSTPVGRKGALKSAAKKAEPSAIAKKLKATKKAVEKQAAAIKADPKKALKKAVAKITPKIKAATKSAAKTLIKTVVKGIVAKAVPKKSTAKKTTAKKAAPKKSAAKITAATKAAPKKSAAKKTAATKAAPKKSASKKTVARKATKKAVTKKAPPKKVAAKTAAKPKKKTVAKTKTANATKKGAAKQTAAKTKTAAKKKSSTKAR